MEISLSNDLKIIVHVDICYEVEKLIFFNHL